MLHADYNVDEDVICNLFYFSCSAVTARIRYAFEQQPHGPSISIPPGYAYPGEKSLRQYMQMLVNPHADAHALSDPMAVILTRRSERSKSKNVSSPFCSEVWFHAPEPTHLKHHYPILFYSTHPEKTWLQPQLCSTPNWPGFFHMSSSKLKKMVLAPTFSMMLKMAVR
jgi:hypothetical protein